MERELCKGTIMIDKLSLFSPYIQLLVEENNSLKEILKDAVIIGDDENITDVCVYVGTEQNN